MTIKFLNEKLHDFLTEDSGVCISLGVDKNLGKLNDLGKNALASRIGKAFIFRADYERIEDQELDFDEKIDKDLALHIIDGIITFNSLEIDGVNQNYRMPRAADEISNGIFMLFINDPREEKYRLVNIITRLEGVPELIRQVCQTLKDPVKRWVDIEMQKIEGLPSLFETILGWAKEVEFKNIARLEKAIKTASGALNQYMNHLRVVTTTDNIHLGMEQTEKVLAARGIDLSPKELHDIAKDFLARNAKEVESLRADLCEKYDLDMNTDAEALQEHLNAKYQVKRPEGEEGLDFILKRYQAEREKILAYIKEHNLFPVFEKQDMNIMKTPAFMEPSIPAGAMMGPMAFREGVKTSLVYLTLKEELLPEHTEISIPAMMIHEGIPGHHLQLAWGASNPRLIRKHVDAMEHAEGWTTMLEDFMLDHGYGNDLADEIRFITKRDIARIGARVAIDLYFMSGDKEFLSVGIDCDLSSDDPFICAGELLKKVTGFVDGRVQAELNWYSQERGYPLSYLTGNTLVWRLKHEMEEKLKGKKSQGEIDRLFHKIYLESGNMPLKYLRKILENQKLI